MLSSGTLIMFITNERAVVIDDTLIISDIHLGITAEIYKSGVALPSQLPRFLERLHALKKLSKAKELVLLGDVKHNIPNITFQELKEIPAFFSSLRFEKITVIKGNHDGKIESLIPHDSKIKVKKSMV